MQEEIKKAYSIEEASRFFTEDISRVDDINFVINYLSFHENRFKSLAEAKAFFAQDEINAARQKIRALEEEIKRQELAILRAERDVRAFKRQESAESGNRKPGRPERVEDRGIAAKNFLSAWIASLMQELGVTSCARLAEMVDLTEERNWRRWRAENGSIPTFSTFEDLLSRKITAGKYEGRELRDVPTSPGSLALLTLLRFV